MFFSPGRRRREGRKRDKRTEQKQTMQKQKTETQRGIEKTGRDGRTGPASSS